MVLAAAAARSTRRRGRSDTTTFSTGCVGSAGGGRKSTTLPSQLNVRFRRAVAETGRQAGFATLPLQRWRRRAVTTTAAVDVILDNHIASLEAVARSPSLSSTSLHTARVTVQRRAAETST